MFIALVLRKLCIVGACLSADKLSPPSVGVPQSCKIHKNIDLIDFLAHFLLLIP